MKDRVFLQALEVSTLIGVYEWERLAPQSLWLDLTIEFDCTAAGENDDILLALDYFQLSQGIRNWASQQSFQLIEAFGHHLCLWLHQNFALRHLDLRINKKTALDNCVGVGIHLERTF